MMAFNSSGDSPVLTSTSTPRSWNTAMAAGLSLSLTSTLTMTFPPVGAAGLLLFLGAGRECVDGIYFAKSADTWS